MLKHYNNDKGNGNFRDCSDKQTEKTNRRLYHPCTLYPKKVGLKEKTRKAYEKLSEADKMEAILYIPELIKLKKDGTAYPYPATYLNQKYWK